ncbi:MAG: cysteine desulfurase NifS [Clostridia bacterium]
MNKFVYADNAATTPISPYVLDAMMPHLTSEYGNASSLYSIGQKTKQAMEESRQKVADAIGAKSKDEIIFTAGGSESDNLALKGYMFGRSRKGTHIITSKIEHHALLETCNFLEKQGFEVTYLDVDGNGMISLDDLKAAFRPETAIVSIMSANNEVGTIQPIKEIGTLCRENGIIFHTDAVQAIGHMPIDVVDMNIDMLSLSGHKINAPKGVGALYCRKGIHLEPVIHGGGQERRLRGGTENMASIVGLGAAIEHSIANIDANTAHAKALRDRLIEGVMKIPYTHLTGHPETRLPGTASFVFEAIEGEGLLLWLDMNGICASTGSACASGSLDPSHVLMAMGLPHEIAHGSLRLTLAHQNTVEDVDYLIEKLNEIVNRLRQMSPIWETMMKENN